MSLGAGNLVMSPMDIKAIQIQHIEFATKWAKRIKRTIERRSTRIISIPTHFDYQTGI